MGHRRKDRSEPVDGILLLDKPAGITSNRALQEVKRLLRAAKAGHTGALDPAATGMLPLCFGEATKVCAYLLDADKTYRVTARLGSATDTGDADGTETTTAAIPDRDAAAWQAILDEFRGESLQVPPMYSALKQGGKRLYELARKGETVERKPRSIRIEAIELLEAAGSRLVFRVRCSKGTYVRTLVEDIAARAGTVAHTARLHREQVDPFEAGGVVSLEAARDLAVAGDLRGRLLPADRALVELPECRVGQEAGDRFRGGQAVSAEPCEAVTGLVRVYADGPEFLGVGELSATGQVAPRRVFTAAEKKP